MYSLNRAEIIGNVTRDIESRVTPNGQAVASFSVATNRRWKDKEGNSQEATEFHNVVAWGKLAELMAQYVHKGAKIYIQGRLQTRQWEGQDGGKRNRTEIVMEDFVFLTPKSASSKSSAPSSSEPITKAAPVEIEKAPEESKAKKEEQKTKKNEVENKEEEINLDDIPF